MSDEQRDIQIDANDLSARIQEVFTRFDKDGGGSLDRHELHSVFKTLGPNFTAKQINNFCKLLDKGGDGQVSHGEFMTFLTSGIGEAKEVLAVIIKATGDSIAAAVREVFNRFDSDGGGSLDMTELQRVFRTLNPDLEMSDLAQLCKELDRGGDGAVSFKEFLVWLKRGGDWAKSMQRAVMKNTGEARDERIKKAFAKYDATGDGNLDIPELEKTLKVLGTFSNDEVRNVLSDLDRSGDGQVSLDEFTAWIKSGKGAKEVHKAKAILAPSDGDGLEAVFYNFCGAGHSDMDGKNFKKLCQDCDLLDKNLNATAVDIIFNDRRVKDKSQRSIDFFQFENALEILAEKKGTKKTLIRVPILLQGTPKVSGTKCTMMNSRLTQKGNEKTLEEIQALGPRKPKRSPSEQRILKILRMTDNEIAGHESWRKNTDNTKLWKVFGLDTAAGQTLRRIYNPPQVLAGPLARKGSKRSGNVSGAPDSWQSPFITLSSSFSTPALPALA